MKISRKDGCVGKPMSEEAIVRRLVAHLTAQGYRVRIEVPNMGQSADVVATRNRWVTVIEAKRRDWRRAILQCRAHEQVADFVCIAIGTVTVSDALREEAEQAGYGLIHCPPEPMSCMWILTPRRNANVWAPQRERLGEVLKEIEYEY